MINGLIFRRPIISTLKIKKDYKNHIRIKKSLMGDTMRKKYLINSISKINTFIAIVSDTHKNDRILRERSKRDLYSVTAEDPIQHSQSSSRPKSGLK